MNQRVARGNGRDAISLWTSRLPWPIAQPAIVRSFYGRLPALFRIRLRPFACLRVEKPLPPVVAHGLSSFYRPWITGCIIDAAACGLQIRERFWFWPCASTLAAFCGVAFCASARVASRGQAQVARPAGVAYCGPPRPASRAARPSSFSYHSKITSATDETTVARPQRPARKPGD